MSSAVKNPIYKLYSALVSFSVAGGSILATYENQMFTSVVHAKTAAGTWTLTFAGESLTPTTKKCFFVNGATLQTGHAQALWALGAGAVGSVRIQLAAQVATITYRDALNAIVDPPSTMNFFVEFRLYP